MSDQISTSSLTPEPPRSIHINIDTIRKSDIPQQWPEPIVSYSNSMYSFEQYYLAPIDSSGNLLFLKIDSLLVLIIKNNPDIDDKKSSTLFEKTDLIIICTDSTEYAESIRHHFRPRLCISTSQPPPDRAQESNMVFTRKQRCSIECSISGKKSIKIAKIR